MAQLFSNYAITQTVSAISDTDTVIDVTPLDGGKFRAPGAGAYELLTLTDGVNWEVVKCTQRINDQFTVERAHEGSAQPWATGTLIKSSVTRKTMEALLQKDTYGASIAMFNYLNFR